MKYSPSCSMIAVNSLATLIPIVPAPLGPAAAA
jgi:hypothetical protein